MIIKFWWDDGNKYITLEITHSGYEVDREEIENLLNDYRNSDEYYNNAEEIGWIEYLEDRDYIVKDVTEEYSMHIGI